MKDSPEGTSWKGILSKASEAALRATSRIQSSQRTKVLERGASGDMTLLADREAEKSVIDILSRIPGLGILSEEVGWYSSFESGYVAVVDPLDGSANFERGIPFYCTSIAIAKGESIGDVIVAHVRNLTNGDIYHAEKGKGATKNGSRIRVSKQRELTDAVLGADLSRAPAEVAASLGPLISSVRRQVHFGAVALEMCFLAEGRLDAYVDIRGRMRAFDLAAAFLIATEAGATITNQDGRPLDTKLEMGSRFSFVSSSSKELHMKLLGSLGSGPRQAA